MTALIYFKIHIFNPQSPSLSLEYLEPAIFNESILSILDNTIFTLSQAVMQLAGFEHLSPKLSNLYGRIYDKVVASYVREEDEFNVLIHGDLWSNNVMFGYAENGAVKDAIFVDFQIGYWGSAILDVVYTLFTSSAEAMRGHDWNECVLHYHAELVRLLKTLKYSKKIPSLDVIQEDRMKRGDHAAVMAIYGLVMRNIDDTEEDAIGMFMRRSEVDDRKRLEQMLKPKIRPNLEFLIQFLNENGHFN